MYAFKFIDFGRDLYFLHDVSPFVCIKVRAPVHLFLNVSYKFRSTCRCLFYGSGLRRPSNIRQWQTVSWPSGNVGPYSFPPIHCRLVDQYWPVSHFFLYVCVVLLRFWKSNCTFLLIYLFILYSKFRLRYLPVCTLCVDLSWLSGFCWYGS